jgi:DNA-binding NarL/FixJ family response regulator
MLEDDTSVLAAMRAGARGRILKGADPDEIIRAITAVAAGEVIFGAALAARMATFFRSRSRNAVPAFPPASQPANGTQQPVQHPRQAAGRRPVGRYCPGS